MMNHNVEDDGDTLLMNSLRLAIQNKDPTIQAILQQMSPNSSEHEQQQQEQENGDSETTPADDEDEEDIERFLCEMGNISVLWGNNSDGEDGSETLMGVEHQQQQQQQQPKGHVVITSNRLLFVSTPAANVAGQSLDNSNSGSNNQNENNSNSNYTDFSIDAKDIDLHATSSEPVPSVYIQITKSDENNYSFGIPSNGTAAEGNNDENDNGMILPIELTLIPICDGGISKQEEACQLLFQSLSELISLHPTYDDDDDEEYYDDGGGGGNDMMFFADDEPIVMSNGGSNGIHNGIINHHNDVVRGVGEVTEQERQAMLERLDNMLVVPPELQITGQPQEEEEDGQFDDAEEEDDDLL